MATKKSAAKKTAVKKTAAGRSAAKKTSGTRLAVKETAAKRQVQKSAAAHKTPAPRKTPTPHKTPSKSKGADNYTKPDLRAKIKDEVMAGDKGGRPGQWSARKAQLVAHEYVAEGGGYKHERTETQEHLKEWGEEKWHTADGKPAIQDDGKSGETTHRYLPDKAWGELSPEERKATDEKKVRGSREGKQFVANTPKAAKARKHAIETS